jgi:SH3 domain-containing YSC84-like protein 1
MKTRFCLVVLLAFVSWQWSIRSSAGQAFLPAEPSREAVVVDSAAEVLGQIMSIPARSIPESLLASAEGIAIIPGMLKGGFIVGVRHGRGVVVTREGPGKWKPPVFVQITGASVGWQIGVQGTDLVLVFCTKKSLDNLTHGKFTIGVNASAAAGPVGRDAQAATDAALKAEIYSYSRSRGLFAGVALDGAVLSIDQAATSTYYQPLAPAGQPAGQPAVLPPSAARLQEQLAKYTTTSVPPPPAATPAAVDRPTLRRQLANSSQQLAAILDADWRTYLALPAEIYVGDREPAAAAVRRPLDRFSAVAAEPRYQSLTQRPEFQATLSLLRQYAAAVPPPSQPPLSLPAPPR